MGSKKVLVSTEPLEITPPGHRKITWRVLPNHLNRKFAFYITAALTLISVIAILGVNGKLRRLVFWPKRMEWVTIPAGAFTMGGGAQTNIIASDDESPQHSVYLDRYKINKYEITNQQYLQCIRAGICEKPKNNKYHKKEYQMFPVTDIQWYDAHAYCEWTGTRLPTEAEWEKAAQGLDGKTLPWIEGIYCWQMNYGAKCFEGITDVGIQPNDTSFYGAKDLAGNAWEWVADWYDPNYYSISPYKNPQGIPIGVVRVLRGGGAWRSIGGIARIADRDYLAPDQLGYNIGFRCVKRLD